MNDPGTKGLSDKPADPGISSRRRAGSRSRREIGDIGSRNIDWAALGAAKAVVGAPGPDFCPMPSAVAVSRAGGPFPGGKEAVGPSACLVPRPSRSGSIDDLSVAACLASGGGLSVGVRNSLKGRWRAEFSRALIDSRIGRGFCVITG
jgi:hypothetical protein